MSDPISTKTRPDFPSAPKGEKGRRTYESILKAAQEILEEDGIEALSSNAIVKRAGVNIPIFYRYFRDKYALLLVLGKRLTEAQDTVYERAMLAPPPFKFEETYVFTRRSMELIYEVTNSFKGGQPLLIALRAIPKLAHVRLEASDRLSQLSARHLMSVNPKISETEAFERCRLGVELGYSTVEILLEVPSLNKDFMIDQTAKAIAGILLETG
ncbi:MAG: TetR/AcrR family transcriptional regulator [Pseudomonadota bacterium]